ncbi:holliday junction ATP-dependent DNA helicase [Escherichia coli]|uniref:Holliday junction ATP-dependent DNA helicase n=1 Tax=Escherichia coli TaxID=562 RepID=A0A377BN63_ECOLX|nr:holliday junction ATP-dependent DNA helicase [Escherichia coli]
MPDLQYIVSRSARFMGLEMSDDGALEVARRARGTPRIANRLLRRVRDFAEVKHDGTISAEYRCSGVGYVECRCLKVSIIWTASYCWR